MAGKSLENLTQAGLGVAAEPGNRVERSTYVLTSRLLALFTRQVVDDLIIAMSRKASDLDVEKIVERHVRRNSNERLSNTLSSCR